MKIHAATMTLAIAMTMTLLSACAGPPPAPIVDMTDVDQATYNKDLAGCYASIGAFEWGNPVTRCMSEKGYTILAGF